MKYTFRMSLVIVLLLIVSWSVFAQESKTTLTGHAVEVNAVAFNPNGTQVVSVSSDASVKLWNVKKGSLDLQFTLLGHESFVSVVAFSADGKYLATGGADKIIKIWSADKGVFIKDLTGHTAAIRSVAFSPDGKLLASASSDNNFKLWNLTAGKIDKDFPYFSTGTESVAFSPDGTEVAIAVGGFDNGIKVYNIKGQTLTAKFVDKGSFMSMAYSPDGKYLVSSHNTADIQLWDIGKEALLKEFNGHTGRVGSVAFSPDGQFIASNADDDTIKLWDVEKGEVVKSFVKHSGGTLTFAYSPNGKSIVSGGMDKLVKLWDFNSSENTVKKQRINMTAVEKEEDRRLAELELQRQYAQSRIAAMKKGLLYSEPTYWQQYSHTNTMSSIFNGDMESDDRDYRFAFIYLAFLSTYNKFCQEHIPPGSPGFKITELTTITANYISTTYEGAVRELRMKEKFYGPFKRYQKIAVMPGFTSVLQIVMNARDAGKMESAKNFLMGVRDDMSRLYSAGECGSAFLMQFEENLYRLGSYLPPLQEDKKTHPYFNMEKNS